MDIASLGNGSDTQPEYAPGSWMVEPRRSCSAVYGGGAHFYVDNKEVGEQEYHAVLRAQREADRIARSEKEFNVIKDAFAYAETLTDGVVLDWGRTYAAMERAGLDIGFVIEPHEQPVVTPKDLLVRPGPNHILIRRDSVRLGLGPCSTDFTHPENSWSIDDVTVMHDGTRNYREGQHLKVEIVGRDVWGSHPTVGANWRMKLISPNDVVAVL